MRRGTAMADAEHAIAARRRSRRSSRRRRWRRRRSASIATSSSWRVAPRRPADRVGCAPPLRFVRHEAGRYLVAAELAHEPVEQRGRTRIVQLRLRRARTRIRYSRPPGTGGIFPAGRETTGPRRVRRRRRARGSRGSAACSRRADQRWRTLRSCRARRRQRHDEAAPDHFCVATPSTIAVEQLYTTAVVPKHQLISLLRAEK